MMRLVPIVALLLCLTLPGLLFAEETQSHEKGIDNSIEMRVVTVTAGKYKLERGADTIDEVLKENGFGLDLSYKLNWRNMLAGVEISYLSMHQSNSSGEIWNNEKSFDNAASIMILAGLEFEILKNVLSLDVHHGSGIGLLWVLDRRYLGYQYTFRFGTTVSISERIGVSAKFGVLGSRTFKNELYKNRTDTDSLGDAELRRVLYQMGLGIVYRF